MNRARRPAASRRPAQPAVLVAEPLESRRLFAAGVLDASFSGDGKVTAPITPLSTLSGASAAAVRADGKFYVAGTTHYRYPESFDEYNEVVVGRFNADGSPDMAFGGEGIVGVLSSAYGTFVSDVAFDASGRVYVSGYSQEEGHFVARLTASGGSDVGFAGKGIVSLGLAWAVNGLAVQPDGKVVVAGSLDVGPSTDVAVARFNVDGSPDATFGGGDGIATRSFGGDEEAADVAVRSDGRLAVACTLAPYGDSRIGFWLTTSTGGHVNAKTLTVGGGSERAQGLALAPDDAAIVFGQQQAGTTSTVAALAKFDAAGNVAGGFGGGDGFLTVPLGTAYATVGDGVVAPDGKILLAGNAESKFTVARLTAAGALDPTFDGDGRRTVDFGGGYIAAVGVGRSSNGDVVAAGGGYTPADGQGLAAARLNADGSLDGAFGAGGTVFADYDADNAVADVAVTAGGKVVTVGTQQYGTQPGDFAIARHNADGTPDGEFGFDFAGRRTLDFGGDDRATAVEVLPDGKVLVAGYSTRPGEKATFVVARLDADGDTDQTWAEDGRRTIAFAGFNARAWDLKVQPDGKILIAGGAGNATSNIAGDFAVARLTANGDLDTSFSGDGLARVNFGANLSTVARGMKVQTNGRIVLAGWAGGNAAVARLLANGSPDNSFSGDGKLLTDWGSSADQYYGVDVDASNRIVVGGSAGSNMVAARYTAGGVLDATFDGDGKRTGPAGRAHAVLSQASGKVILAGTNAVGGGSAFRLVRFTAAGGYDGVFGGGDGIVDTTFAGKTPRAATALAFAPNSKLVAGGFVTGSDGDEDFALARYSLV